MANNFSTTPGSGETVTGVDISTFTAYPSTGKVPASVLYVSQAAASAPTPVTTSNPVPVSVQGSITATTGGLTDAQLRNSAVPVSGPATNAELRASALPVSDSGTASASHAAAVTPSDSTTFSPATRGLYVGGAGNVVVDTSGGETDVTFPSVPAGTVLPVQVTKVKAATTATNIVRLW